MLKETNAVRRSPSGYPSDPGIFCLWDSVPRRVFLAQQQVTSMMIWENRNGMSRQRACVACLAIEVCSLPRGHQTCSVTVPSQSKIAFFKLDGVFHPSSVQAALSLIRPRLNRLQTVTVRDLQSRRAMDKVSKLNTSRLLASVRTRRSGSSQLALAETLSRTACLRTELHCKPARILDQFSRNVVLACTMCQDRVLGWRPSQHQQWDQYRRLSTGVTSEGQRGGEDNDARSRRTEASKEEGYTTNDDSLQHRVQFRSSIHCDNRLGDANAPKHLDTTITSILSGDPSVAPHCCEPPFRGKDEGTSGER